jgi:hypothetical protein
MRKRNAVCRTQGVGARKSITSWMVTGRHLFSNMAFSGVPKTGMTLAFARFYPARILSLTMMGMHAGRIVLRRPTLNSLGAMKGD